MFTSSDLRLRRKSRQRYKIRSHVVDRPRLCVHRSSNHMYAQVIDDGQGVTLAAVSTLTKEARSLFKQTGGKEAAAYVGKKIADLAIQLGVKKVVFDRSGFLYHGRVKALADGAREAGLEF